MQLAWSSNLRPVTYLLSFFSKVGGGGVGDFIIFFDQLSRYFRQFETLLDFVSFLPKVIPTFHLGVGVVVMVAKFVGGPLFFGIGLANII